MSKKNQAMQFSVKPSFKNVGGQCLKRLARPTEKARYRVNTKGRKIR